MLENKDLDKIEYKDVRGFEGIKEATVEINNKEYTVAVVKQGIMVTVNTFFGSRFSIAG